MGHRNKKGVLSYVGYIKGHFCFPRFGNRKIWKWKCAKNDADSLIREVILGHDRLGFYPLFSLNVISYFIRETFLSLKAVLVSKIIVNLNCHHLKF